MESTSARDLDRRLADLVRSERHLVVQFVIELAGFAKRELHRELGYPSLFYYCVRQLGLSKSSAFRRSEVARLIARFPAIADRLATGRLSIRALVELRDVLTEENHAAVLARAEGKSREEAEILAVEIRPKPVPRDVVRALPTSPARPAGCAVVPAETNSPAGRHAPPNLCAAVPAETNSPAGPHTPPKLSAAVPAETNSPAGPFAPLGPPAGRVSPAVVSAGTNPSGRPPEVVEPLTPHLRRLNVTVSADFIAELEQVRAALSHQCPDGDFEQVVREAFKLVLERDRKRKALTDRPRVQPKRRSPATAGPATPESATPGSATPGSATPGPATPEPATPGPAAPGPATPGPAAPGPATPGPATPGENHRDRYVPAAVKRAVWQRDQGRCTWPMGDGAKCGATHRLELDHDLEVALGGKATVGNIRLLCRSHNLMKAEQRLGRAFMARFRKGAATERAPPDR